jgi:hypothetical protein
MRTVPPTEKGKYRAIASGAIANGKPVVVNSAGTVSVVSGTALALGSETEFTSDASNYNSVAFDSNSNRIVVAHKNGANNNGMAVVGTVSGTSVSFGTRVAFDDSGEAEFYGITFDSNENKIVIAYRDTTDSNKGKAVVGTVDPSDNSISFGSQATFTTNNAVYNDACFDSSTNKVVIVYTDNGNSAFGTAVVATVSGTSISFGTPVVFNSANTMWPRTVYDSDEERVVVGYIDVGNNYYPSMCVGTVSGTSISFGSEIRVVATGGDYVGLAYDSTNQVVVMAYHDNSNSSYGTAVVGDVNNTEFNSLGTPVVFESADNAYIDAVFDASTGKVVIAYRDVDNSNAGTYVIGTVGSSNSISFNTPATFNTNTEYIGLGYDSNAEKVVIAYKDAGDGDDGTVRILQNEVPTNLTTENYIGIANSCSFHGNTETITVTVASGIFYLDGVANPVIQLLKGHTYIFDQADNTNDGHPLHFKDSGGSQYTTGVTVTGTAGTSGAKVTIAIASNATEPTRYYCTVHGNGMGNTINLSDSFVNVDVIGTVNDQQSSLTAGQQYFVQEDGTLGLTADSTSVFAGTAISATELVVKE